MFNRFGYKDNVSKFDLTLTGTEAGDSLFFSFHYCTKIFRRETIKRFIRNFKKIISSVIKFFNIKISEILIISDDEKKRLLFEFNRTTVNYSEDTTVHGLFENQVESTSDNVAVVFKDNQLSYSQLNFQLNQAR